MSLMRKEDDYVVNSKIKISFGIVTFNSANELPSLLKSIENELKNCNEISSEIYIVDNGSADQTLEIIKAYSSDYINIRVLPNKKNLGFGGAHNKIISAVTSKYHFIVNPDIVLPGDDEILKMVSFFEEKPDVGLISPMIKSMDGDVQLLNKYNPTVFDMAIRFLPNNFFKTRKERFVKKGFGYTKAQHIDFASGAFMAFRTSVLRQIDGFDERYFMYFEDADITRKLQQITRTVYLPTTFVFHKWARESHRNLKMFGIQVNSMIKYFNKWGWNFFAMKK